jgi:hypothetical protein
MIGQESECVHKCFLLSLICLSSHSLDNDVKVFSEVVGDFYFACLPDITNCFN